MCGWLLEAVLTTVDFPRVYHTAASLSYIWARDRLTITIVDLSCSFSSLMRSRLIWSFTFSLEITLIVLIRALSSCGRFYSSSKLCKLSLLIFKLTLRSSFSCFWRWTYLSNSFTREVATSSSYWICSYIPSGGDLILLYTGREGTWLLFEVMAAILKNGVENLCS